MNEIKLPKLKTNSQVKARKKKKIMLLADDLRMSSGVGTMSREFVLGTLDRYDWVQIGGAIKHPENGKVINMNDSVRKDTGVEDADLKIYAVNGYGSQEMVRNLIQVEKPDAIMIYTDPRFWVWLYQIEHEIRQNIPIFYYNIWDDWPAPKYNEWYYESCDLIMNISKQSVAIVKDVWETNPPEDWQVTYIPHGINEDFFYPIDELHSEYNELNKYKNRILENKQYDFIVYYNNRNIRRKMPGDVVLAFKTFCDMLPKERAKKCALLFHTQPVDDNGTDIPAVVEAVAPECNVHYSVNKEDNKHMNFLYNIADVTINIASNEGFGLATCESLMSGTPIIVNVTGGLQDQCGFRLRKPNDDNSGYTDEFLTSKDYDKIKSLHDDKKWANNENLTHGEWVKPVWPSNRALVGSVPTPYIFDDRCRFDDAADRIKEWYDAGNEERERCGGLGREFVLSDDAMMTAKNMCKNFISHMDTAFEKWKPKKPFKLHKV